QLTLLVGLAARRDVHADQLRPVPAPAVVVAGQGLHVLSDVVARRRGPGSDLVAVAAQAATRTGAVRADDHGGWQLGQVGGDPAVVVVGGAEDARVHLCLRQNLSGRLPDDAAAGAFLVALEPQRRCGRVVGDA